jgi:glycosyltransferase involved in cell wall biosynthesis
VQVTHLLYLSQKSGQNPFSGAETPTLDLVCELARAGVDVELLVVEWNSGPLIDERLQALMKEGVRVTRVVRRQEGLPRGRLLRALECWLRLAQELRRPRPLVHVHLDLVVAPLLCRLGRARRVVATVHSDAPGYASRRWRLWSMLLNRMVDQFVAISSRVASFYAGAAGLPSGSVPVVRYPVGPARSDPTAVAKTRPIGARFVVGCVARLAPEKNVMLVAEVLRREPSWHGILVGEGPERPRLERFIADHGMSNLQLLGAVPVARRLMPAFDVLVLPSRWEGLGLVLVEAMFAKVPIVASRAGAIPETLGGGRFGLLFQAGSVDALHASLRLVAEGRVDLAAMTAAARVDAEQRYAPARIREGILAVYEGVTGG